MRKNLLTLDVILAKEIKYMLESEEYIYGMKLPSERILAEKFNVQRTTIRSALQILVNENYIHSEERKGYYISKRRIVIPTKKVSSLSDFYSPDRNLEFKINHFEKVLVDDALESKTMLPQGTPVHHITYVLLEDGKPILLENAYVPCEILPDLSKEQLINKSITEFFNDNNIETYKSNQKVTLIYTNQDESRILNVALGTPFTKYKGLVYNSSSTLVLFFECLLAKDDFMFIRRK